eukprot:Tbor_TRINITY_DN6667_c0_g1::TRINITY_DN6667_c0_g1_i1::g.3119::m.3119
MSRRHNFFVDPSENNLVSFEAYNIDALITASTDNLNGGENIQVTKLHEHMASHSITTSVFVIFDNVPRFISLAGFLNYIEPFAHMLVAAKCFVPCPDVKELRVSDDASGEVAEICDVTDASGVTLGAIISEKDDKCKAAREAPKEEYESSRAVKEAPWSVLLDTGRTEEVYSVLCEFSLRGGDDSDESPRETKLQNDAPQTANPQSYLKFLKDLCHEYEGACISALLRGGVADEEDRGFVGSTHKDEGKVGVLKLYVLPTTRSMTVSLMSVVDEIIGVSGLPTNGQLCTHVADAASGQDQETSSQAVKLCLTTAFGIDEGTIASPPPLEYITEDIPIRSFLLPRCPLLAGSLSDPTCPNSDTYRYHHQSNPSGDMSAIGSSLPSNKQTQSKKGTLPSVFGRGEYSHVDSDDINRPQGLLDSSAGNLCKHNPQQALCSICIDPLHNFPIITTFCEHQFHIHCLSQTEQPQCPLCRFNLAVVFSPISNIKSPTNSAMVGEQMMYPCQLGRNPCFTEGENESFCQSALIMSSISSPCSTKPYLLLDAVPIPTHSGMLIQEHQDRLSQILLNAGRGGTKRRNNYHHSPAYCPNSYSVNHQVGVRSRSAGSHNSNSTTTTTTVVHSIGGSSSGLSCCLCTSLVHAGSEGVGGRGSNYRTESLWLCLVCGAVHCGGHGDEHYRVSSHRFSVDVAGPRVWDFAKRSYAHRALIEAQLQQQPKPSKETGDDISKSSLRKALWSDPFTKDEENQLKLLSNVEQVREFYSKLLEDQLRAQQLYYEAELADQRLLTSISELVAEESKIRASFQQDESVNYVKEIINPTIELLKKDTQRNKKQIGQLLQKKSDVAKGKGNIDNILYALEVAEKNHEAVTKMKVTMQKQEGKHQVIIKAKDDEISRLEKEMEKLYMKLTED